MVVLLLLALGGWGQAPAFSREVVPPAAEPPAGYSSLSELVVMLGRDAAGQFSSFFDPGPVRVEPFPVLGEFPSRRISVLGATLADQMVATINSIPGSEPGEEPMGEQVLRGVIQEIDGYLRVHLSGRNGRGEWRSYVANVEMSAAVYRAMHTYVSYER